MRDRCTHPRNRMHGGALLGSRVWMVALAACTTTGAVTTVHAADPHTGRAAVVAIASPEIRPATHADLKAAVEAARGHVVVLNVWATWCGPCRAEFPDLLQLYRTYRERGMELMLVSADFDDQLGAARAFLAANDVDFPTYLKTGDDMEFIDSIDPGWTGALPATFVYDETGRLRTFWEGRATYAEMERRILPVLGSASEDPGPKRRP